MIMESIAVYHYKYLPISETFIYRQLQGLAAEFDVRLMTSALDNLEIYPDFRPMVVPVAGIRERIALRFRPKPFSLSQEQYLRDQLRGCRLLHVNFGNDGLRFSKIAVSAGVPLTCYFHGVDASALLGKSAIRSGYRDADFEAAITVSREMQKRLAPHLGRTARFHVNRLGIPLALFPFKWRKWTGGGTVFLQVSRLVPKKGIDTTLRVFSRYLRDCDPSARLVLAGDGPLREALQRHATCLKIEDSVSFLGPVTYPETMRLMHSCDVYLHHSVTAPNGDMEGIPISIEEAMACGMPVVSTYHSGIPELIEHEANGFLVNEHDEEGYLAVLSKLRRTDIGGISLRARQRIEEEFDLKVTNAELTNFLKSIW